MIKTTPDSTADIRSKWDELVKSGKYRLGSKAAGGYVDNETGQWYSGERGPGKMLDRSSRWNDLIAQGRFRRGSAGGYVDNQSGEWHAPDAAPPEDDEQV